RAKEQISAALGAEAFASLRTNLQHHRDGAMRTVVVTSCAPKDGKSTVGSNLGTAFAKSGTRVLLVDCDLRRPRLHRTFGEDLSPGLTDVLQGVVPLERAMIPIGTDATLFLLAAGTPVSNPSELVGSDAMRALIKELSSRFSLVVLDSPPL